MIEALLAIVGLIAGFGANTVITKQRQGSAEAKIEKELQKAKKEAEKLVSQAREEANRAVDETRREEQSRRGELKDLEKRLISREENLDKKLDELDKRNENLHKNEDEVEHLKNEIREIRGKQQEKLEKIAKLTKSEAAEKLMQMTERDIKQDLLGLVTKLQNEARNNAEEKAALIITTAMERMASEVTAERTVSSIKLEDDEMKGRIIGREGRNIKAIEQLTGVEIVVDDTPEAILVSGFSPIRRHLAKRALDKLIADGRIHPGRIEQVVEEAKKELALDIKVAGEDAVREIGLAGVDPKLVQILGRLKYRTSYGQNQLKHALEVAHLSSLLAAELGADVAKAKKGGLFHDIGKAVDHEVQGGHPQIGYDILKKFGFSEELAYMALGHHEDAPKTLECIIVKVADAISGSRRGARKDSYEDYLQRLDELEGLANNFAGVEKTFAIQAGREVRVFVTPDEVDDWQATKLARDIADKIEQELKYPGEIKVNVIREKRITEYAR